MAEKLRQLGSLTAIRKLVEKDFPTVPFYYVENQLTGQIDLEENEEIEWDEERGYILKTFPVCKVCRSLAYLTEIQTLRGSFHICNSCRRDIAAVTPEAIIA